MEKTFADRIVDLDRYAKPIGCMIDGAEASTESVSVMLTPTNQYGVYCAEIAGTEVPVYITSDGIDQVQVSLRGYSFTARVLRSNHSRYLEILNESPALRTRATRIATPMPGLLKSILVPDGAEVQKGQQLFTLEAMKMENSIVSPIRGVVRDIGVAEGQAVEKGHRLCTIEPLGT